MDLTILENVAGHLLCSFDTALMTLPQYKAIPVQEPRYIEEHAVDGRREKAVPVQSLGKGRDGSAQSLRRVDGRLLLTTEKLAIGVPYHRAGNDKPQ